MSEKAANQHKQAVQRYFIKDLAVNVPLGDVNLEGRLSIPEDAKGIVIFAHGSGSSRHSQRNRYVAEVLNEYGLATLLIDLLSQDEETIDQQTRYYRFNIPMLARRLEGIADYTHEAPETHSLNIGYFGSSTGGSAALIAAANLPDKIKAVVSRGGRADLAQDSLHDIKAPTLLIVGERDPQIIKINERAIEQLNSKSVLKIIPNATHLFEEAHTLEEVAHMAAGWFKEYLV